MKCNRCIDKNVIVKKLRNNEKRGEIWTFTKDI